MSDDVRRVASLELLPDGAVLCGWRGHAWDADSAPLVSIGGWGVPAAEMRLSCGSCGRTRRDVVRDDESGALLFRDYGGGCLTDVKVAPSRAECRAEWMRRRRARETGVTTLAARRRGA